MEFSNVFSSNQVVVSNSFIASTSQDRLVLRSKSTLQVLQTHKLLNIHSIAFSPSSEYISIHAGNSVHVFSTSDSSLIASIDLSTPDNNAVKWFSETDIAVFADFKLRVSIWSLAQSPEKASSTRPVAVIQRLKCPPTSGWAFHPAKRYLVLAERSEHRDCLGIYDAYDNWKLVRMKHFDTQTSDLSNLSISPCGSYIAIWDSILEAALFVYTMDGRQLCDFKPEVSTGLGIKSVSWHPQSKYLAVGDHASQIHILSPLTWTKIFTFSPLSNISSKTNVLVHRPPNVDWVALTHSSAIVPFTTSSTSITAFCTQHQQRIDPDKPLKAGILSLDFSPSGNWLAARDASFPKHVFIYCLSDSSDERKGLRTILQYEQQVESLCWRPVFEEDLEVLSIAYGVKAIGLWFSNGGNVGRAEGFGIPQNTEFTAKSVSWSSEGDMLLLKGKEAWCAAYPLGASDVASD